jgi:hypothetical protein
VACGDGLQLRLGPADAGTVDAFSAALHRELLPGARVRGVEASLEDIFIATLEQKERTHA